MSDMSDILPLDYAIVGGGISGIYSAWRLKLANPGKSVALFEQSKRLGGRLLTVVPPGIKTARVELGGMRFIVEAHPWVASLVNHLQLAIEDLAAGEDNNIAYLRGQQLRMSQLTYPNATPTT